MFPVRVGGGGGKPEPPGGGAAVYSLKSAMQQRAVSGGRNGQGITLRLCAGGLADGLPRNGRAGRGRVGGGTFHRNGGKGCVGKNQRRENANSFHSAHTDWSGCQPIGTGDGTEP